MPKDTYTPRHAAGKPKHADLSGQKKTDGYYGGGRYGKHDYIKQPGSVETYMERISNLEAAKELIDRELSRLHAGLALISKGEDQK